MDKGQKIAVPLLTYAYHDRRVAAGTVANGVLATQDGDRLMFGVVTDVTAACAASRAAYDPQIEALPLDFGLSTLFASADGALLGQGWLTALKAYDRRITAIARGQQRRGHKPRQSARYRAAVQDVRGFVKTEVNRVLNRLVAQKRPAALVLERLDFRNPDLSSRLNRIL